MSSPSPDLQQRVPGDPVLLRRLRVPGFRRRLGDTRVPTGGRRRPLGKQGCCFGRGRREQQAR